MADRVFYYAASANRATTASTDYSAVGVSLSFTPSASKVHAVFWTAYLDNDNTFELFGARLRNTTDAVTLGENFWQVPASTSEKQPMGGMAFYTSGASPGPVTLELQYKGNGAITVGIQEAAIFVLELADADITVENTAAGSTAVSGYQTRLTASWSASTTSDYLLVFSAEAFPTTADSGPQLRCTDGTNFFGTCQPRDHGGTGANGQQCYFHMARGLALHSSQDWSIQYGVSFGTDPVTIQNTRILALRLDGITAYAWAEDRTEHSTSSSTFIDSAAVASRLTNAVPYLVLACGVAGSDDPANATLASMRLTIDGTSAVSNNSAQGVFVNNEQPWLYLTSYTASGATTTWATQYARVGGTGVARADDQVVVALELGSGQVSLAPGSVTSSVAMGRGLLAIPHGWDSAATSGTAPVVIPHSITATVALGHVSLVLPHGIGATTAVGTPVSPSGAIDLNVNGFQVTAASGLVPEAIPHGIPVVAALGNPALVITIPPIQQAGSGPWRRWDLLPSIQDVWRRSPQARAAAEARRLEAKRQADWQAQWEAQLQAEADAAQAEMDQAEKFAEALRIIATEVKPLV